MLIDGNVAQYTGHGGTADILGCQYTNIWNKSIVRRYEALSSACNTDRKFDSDHPLIISRLISSVYRVNHWNIDCSAPSNIDVVVYLSSKEWSCFKVLWIFEIYLKSFSPSSVLHSLFQVKGYTQSKTFTLHFSLPQLTGSEQKQNYNLSGFKRKHIIQLQQLQEPHYLLLWFYISN